MEAKEENVVLLDDSGKEIGLMPKSEVHGEKTPLHKGFSFFLFRKDGTFLIQKRAACKKTWPSVWSNSCCGHPAQNESTENAIRRRLKFELGLEVGEIHEILPDYSYSAIYKGVMENEFCPVWIGLEENPKITINPVEVEEINWISWAEFTHSISSKDEKFMYFSPWCLEEALLMNENPLFLKLISSFVK